MEFFSFTTGETLTRNGGTMLPTTNIVINCVHQIADNDGLGETFSITNIAGNKYNPDLINDDASVTTGVTQIKNNEIKNNDKIKNDKIWGNDEDDGGDVIKGAGVRTNHKDNPEGKYNSENNSYNNDASYGTEIEDED